MIFIGLRMLLGDAAKWLGVVLGVFFCTFLITHLLSMFAGMMSRTYAVVSDIPIADIWVMDPAVQNADEPVGIPDTALTRVRGVEGVAWASPLFARSLIVRLPSGVFRAALVIGVDDASLVGLPAGTPPEAVAALRGQDAVIADTESAEGLLRMPVAPKPHEPGWEFPDFHAPTRPLAVGDELLVNDHRVIVVGLADLGPRFLNKPTFYTTFTRAERLAPRERHTLAYVLVRAQPGVDHALLAAHIQEATGLRARTAAQFKDDTYDYYLRTTGVVARIIFMVGIGAGVGVCVSALLLYMFTTQNLPYYALLNAMGATRAKLAAMVAVQSLVSAGTGFGLGMGASCALGLSLHIPAMPFTLQTSNILLTGATVLSVSILSAVFSMIRLFRLEPGIVFAK
ncbi:MAG: ABC transporter permease [Phycisphaerales bacterium]|nr:ABC transporter permease [Phycisphaerales bacterium]